MREQFKRLARSLSICALSIVMLLLCSATTFAQSCFEQFTQFQRHEAIMISLNKMEALENFAESGPLSRILTSKAYLKALDEELEWLASNDALLRQADVDPQFSKIMNRVIDDVDYELSFEELLFLQRNPAYKRLYKIQFLTETYLRATGELMFHLPKRVLMKSLQFAFPNRPKKLQSLHLMKDPNISLKEKARLLWLDLFQPPLRTLGPIPFLRSNRPVDHIFRKLFKTPDYAPTAEELALLDKHKALELFNKNREFTSKHPNYTRVRGYTWAAADAAKFASYLAAANLAYHQTQGGMLSMDEYLQQPLAEDEVQIINDTVPFPHTAFRIGNTVYSYGQTHQKSAAAPYYLRNREVNEIFRERLVGQPDLSETTVSENGSIVGTIDYLKEVGAGVGAKVYELTGLDEMPPSFQVITLKLKPEEIAKIKRAAEDSSFKRYHNNTFVMDCTTMAMCKISENSDILHPHLVDASPSQLAMHFGILKSLGDERVQRIQQVAVEEAESPYKHLARNSWINIMESKLFIEFFLLYKGERLIHELRHKDMEYMDAATSELIKQEWPLEAEKLLEDERQIQIFRKKMVNASAQSAAIHEKAIKLHFDERREFYKGVVDNDYSSFEARTMASYSLEYLNLVEQELQGHLKTIVNKP